MGSIRLTSAVAAFVLSAGCGGSTGPQSLTPDTTPATSPATSLATTAATRSPEATATAARSTPTPSPTRTGATPARSAPAASTVVSDADSGRTVHLRPHERLEVRLSQDSYDPPTASRPQVMTRRSSTGGYPSAAPVAAVFEALAAGEADVSASSDYACFHSAPRCMRPSRLWVVHVIIS